MSAAAVYGAPSRGGDAIVRDPARAVFGQVMGLVAVTVGFAALGAYIGRDLSGGIGIVVFIAAFACVFGLNAASARGHEQLAIGLLFGLGLLLGLAVAPVLAVYAKTDPSVLWQAAGATAAFVARARVLWLRHAPGPVLVGPNLAVGATGSDRARDRPDLRVDPASAHHLRPGRAGDLRRVHDL